MQATPESITHQSPFGEKLIKTELLNPVSKSLKTGTTDRYTRAFLLLFFFNVFEIKNEILSPNNKLVSYHYEILPHYDGIVSHYWKLLIGNNKILYHHNELLTLYDSVIFFHVVEKTLVLVIICSSHSCHSRLHWFCSYLHSNVVCQWSRRLLCFSRTSHCLYWTTQSVLKCVLTNNLSFYNFFF